MAVLELLSNRLIYFWTRTPTKFNPMSDDERNDLAELKVILTKYLAEVEQQILNYDPYADNDKFNFLILKARRYQQTLVEIDRQLLNDD